MIKNHYFDNLIAFNKYFSSLSKVISINIRGISTIGKFNRFRELTTRQDKELIP